MDSGEAIELIDSVRARVEIQQQETRKRLRILQSLLLDIKIVVERAECALKELDEA